MDTLHDRIGRVASTSAFERSLSSKGINKIDFQCTWHRESKGEFANLRPAYQEAVLAGESEISATGKVAIV